MYLCEEENRQRYGFHTKQKKKNVVIKLNNVYMRFFKVWFYFYLINTFILFSV